MANTRTEDIKAFIEGPEIQGKIREDGGDIRFVGRRGYRVEVCMKAACATCPSGERTVRHFVEPKLRDRFSEKITVKAQFEKPYFRG